MLVYHERTCRSLSLPCTKIRISSQRGIVDPSRIKRIDVMAGGDHGQGAFIFGAKVVVVFSGATEQEEDDSFSFEILSDEVLS